MDGTLKAAENRIDALMLGLQSVIATLGLVSIISHVTPMDQNVKALVLLIGLAVGVDYTLVYLRREREERAAGRSQRAALEAAAATSGRSPGQPASPARRCCPAPFTGVSPAEYRDRFRLTR